jgi:hypothetical protein
VPKTPTGPKPPAPPKSTKLKERQRAEFITNAKEAAKRATRGKDYTARHAWLTIASMYRVLAQTVDFPRPKPIPSKKLPAGTSAV